MRHELTIRDIVLFGFKKFNIMVVALILVAVGVFTGLETMYRLRPSAEEDMPPGLATEAEMRAEALEDLKRQEDELIMQLNVQKTVQEYWSGYLEHSLLYSLDPFHTPSAELSFYIDKSGLDGDTIANLILFYQKSFKNERTADTVRRILNKPNLDSSHIYEIVTFSQMSVMIDATDNIIFSIFAYSDKLESAERLVKEVYASLTELVSDNVLPHNTVVVNDVSKVAQSAAVMYNRVNSVDNKIKTDKLVEDLHNRIDAIELQIEDLLEKPESINPPTESRRTGLIAIALGIFAAVLVYLTLLFVSTFNKKIQSADFLGENITFLGYHMISEKKRGFHV